MDEKQKCDAAKLVMNFLLEKFPDITSLDACKVCDLLRDAIIEANL